MQGQRLSIQWQLLSSLSMQGLETDLTVAEAAQCPHLWAESRFLFGSKFIFAEYQSQPGDCQGSVTQLAPQILDTVRSYIGVLSMTVNNCKQKPMYTVSKTSMGQENQLMQLRQLQSTCGICRSFVTVYPNIYMYIHIYLYTALKA